MISYSNLNPALSLSSPSGLQNTPVSRDPSELYSNLSSGPTLQELLSSGDRGVWDLDYSTGWNRLRPEVQQKIADYLSSGKTTDEILTAGRYDLPLGMAGKMVRTQMPGENVGIRANKTGGFNISTRPEFEGAYFDPTKIEFDPEYGLYTPKSNFLGAKTDSSFLSKIAPLIIAGATGGIAAPMAAAALGGGALGTAAGYGAVGAGTGALGATMTGGDIGKGALLGGVGGAIGGGLSSLSGPTGAGMTGAGWSDKALTGAAKGLTSAALRGGDLSDLGEAALLGGVTGGLNTVAPGLGALAGTAYKLATAPDRPALAPRRVTGALTAATMPVRQQPRRKKFRGPTMKGLTFR